MKYDIYLVGVGGQGILTIGEILATAAEQNNLPVSFYPSKGMAQRGGFVRAQLRLGRSGAGPNIPQRGADLAVSMELSEALKAIRYTRPGGDFLLFADVWAPTQVMLGKADYPAREAIENEIRAAGLRLITIDPSALPVHEKTPVAPNVFILGLLIKHTELGKLFTPKMVEDVIDARWKKASAANRFAFQKGMEFVL